MPGIPLTPAKGGGMCIPGSTLQTADLIVSSGKGFVSAGIKVGQGFKERQPCGLIRRWR